MEQSTSSKSRQLGDELYEEGERSPFYDSDSPSDTPSVNRSVISFGKFMYQLQTCLCSRLIIVVPLISVCDQSWQKRNTLNFTNLESSLRVFDQLRSMF